MGKKKPNRRKRMCNLHKKRYLCGSYSRDTFIKTTLEQQFEILGNNWRLKYSDQMVRANSISKHIIHNNIQRIILMDGGRFTWCLLSWLHILKYDSKHLEIILIDIDPEMVSYHREVMNFATVYKMDVTKLHSLNLNKTDLVYMNFCSLGKYAQEAEKAAYEYTHMTGVCYLSFNTRGTKTSQAPKLKKYLLNREETNQNARSLILGKREMCYNVKVSHVSQRGLFHTFKLTTCDN